MYYACITESLSTGKWYYGSTGNISDETKNALKNLSKNAEHIKSERNKMIHEGSFTSDCVQKIIDNNLHWDLTSISKVEALANFYMNRKQDNIAILIKRMETDIDNLNPGISGLLDSLTDELDKTTPCFSSALN